MTEKKIGRNEAKCIAGERFTREAMMRGAAADAQEFQIRALHNLSHATVLEIARLADDEVSFQHTMHTMENALANSCVSVIESMAHSLEMTPERRKNLYDTFMRNVLRCAEATFKSMNQRLDVSEDGSMMVADRGMMRVNQKGLH